MQKVSSLIDIAAPVQEVFNIIVDLERRMQLSPLWGVSKLVEVAPNLPEPGSSYRVRITADSHFGMSHGALNATQSALTGLTHMLSLKLSQADAVSLGRSELVNTDHATQAEEHTALYTLPIEQEYYISEYQPPHKFSYILETDCKTIVTWRCQAITFGTRINYEEVFCDENVVDENFLPTVRHVVTEWLANIKRYSELRTGRGRLLVRWFLDRVYLKLRPDQRRVVLMMLVMQAIGLATFVIAAIGWGVASLFFGF